MKLNKDKSIDYWINATKGKNQQRLKRKIRFKKKIWKLVIFFSEAIKRFLDIVGAMVAMIVFSPIFLITALLIKLEDGGPCIFKQERIGKDGKKFLVSHTRYIPSLY